MRKSTDTKRTNGAGTALALALGLTALTMGCTTNKMPGSGQPSAAQPTVSPSSTPGSSSGTVGRLPASPISAADDAAAIMAAHAGYRGRVLGPISPDSVQRGTPVVTGQFVNPALIANPQSTVNSSISSDPTPVIGDAGSVGGGVGVTGAVTGAVVVAPVTAAVSAAPVTAAAVSNVTATSAALNASVTAASPGVPTPTVSSSLNPPVTAVSNRGTTVSTDSSRPISARSLIAGRPAGSVIVSGGGAVLGTERGTNAAASVGAVTNSSGNVTVARTSLPAPSRGRVVSPSAGVKSGEVSQPALSTSRTRAVSPSTVTNANASAPALNNRGRAVRLVTNTDGTVVVTNH